MGGAAGGRKSAAPRSRGRRIEAHMKQLALGVRLRARRDFRRASAPGPNGEVLSALRGPTATRSGCGEVSGSGKTHLLQAVCAAAAGSSPNGGVFPLDRSAGAAAAGAGGVRALPRAVPGRCRCRGRRCRPGSARCSACSTTPRILRTRMIFAAAARAAPDRLAPGRLALASRARAWSTKCANSMMPGASRHCGCEPRNAACSCRRRRSDYLLKRMPRDLRSLFDILDRLDEASLVAQRRLTIPFIRDALEKHAETKP